MYSLISSIVRKTRTVALILLAGQLLIFATGCSRTSASAVVSAAKPPEAAIAAPVVPADAAFRNTLLSAEERARSLLSYMTLDEKIGQMTQPARDYLGSDSNIAKYGFGSVLSGGGSGPRSNTAASWADMVDGYQKYALGTRLGIPLLYGADAVHGHNNIVGAVIFPHNVGLGASGSEEIVRQAGRVTALEASATGVRWTFAPCVAVPQDERWGRTYEGFGEDSLLVSRLGAAAVLGLQGATDLSQLADTGFILATAKHFVGDGGTVKGKDQGDAVIDEETLRAMHLPPYEAAIKAGVRSVMISFSSWNGVKLHQHKYLITDVLKTELDFSGFVVSDWAGVKQLPGSPKEQIRLAINAGIDMVMVPDSWREFISDLRSLVQSGEVEMARIDDAVYRILLTKFELGLFERPLADRELLALVGSTEHRQLAREAVQASLVVLKNNNILPLSAGLRRIGVVGAAADDIGAQCGGWTITWQGANGAITEGTTILEGIQSLAGPQLQLVYAKTAAELGPVDLAIVVAAEKPYAEGQGDDPVLAFPSGMAAEVKRLKAAGIPVLTILLSGRPLLAADVVTDSDAFIAAWLPGTEGGGIADLLFGKVSPSGTLPFTWFSDIASIPLNAKKAGPGVLFPAGYGLSW